VARSVLGGLPKSLSSKNEPHEDADKALEVANDVRGNAEVKWVPAKIISHCVWLHFRFCLSYRDVGGLMAECGIILTYEQVRDWCRTCGQVYAKQRGLVVV
jgi:Zn finger protein HypA/HybF involved in hydrogenase expression